MAIIEADYTYRHMPHASNATLLGEKKAAHYLLRRWLSRIIIISYAI